MWLTGKVDRSLQKDQIFKDLCNEVRAATPMARISSCLKNKLERLPMLERSQLVNRVREGCTPLFTAAKKGVVEMAKYLITECQANVEQRGVYEVPFDHTMHYVTPLWCAAVVGKLDVCKILVEHGADVNAVSDTGSTAVRSACYMSNIDVVKFLESKGANINKANNNGGTCLINSVQSVELCEFLIQKGASVNAHDSQLKTALHYAVQEDRLETTKLLLNEGADQLAQSKHGDDALQTACLKGAQGIVEFLIENLEYPDERIASSYELLGATFLDEHHNIQRATEYWRKAAQYRQDHILPKRVKSPPRKAFLYMHEFQSIGDITLMENDYELLRIQALLINERVLGATHKDAIFRLMYRGAAYADSLQHQRCIDIWKYAVELRLQKDCLLHHETCVALQSLTKIMFDKLEKFTTGAFDETVLVEDVFFLLNVLLDTIPPAMDQLKYKPIYKKQQENFDRCMMVLVHLLHLGEILEKNETEAQEFSAISRKLVRLSPRSTNGNTLLHMVVGKVESLRPHPFSDRKAIFPDPLTTRLLLEAGAHVEAVNRDGSTALHNASLRVNYMEDIVLMLLEEGAHIDRRNNQGNQPYRMLGGNQECKIRLVRYMTLKCLAASKVRMLKLDYENQIPQQLEGFVDIH